uniref:ATP-dependent RNA helicase n=1 Tax=Piliocolobus tephrosceles TaxID=591936 RepID=A0A8C9H3I8_9PRIM
MKEGKENIAKKENKASDSVTIDSVTIDSVTTDSVTTDSVTTDNVTTDSVTTDSVTTDSVTTNSTTATNNNMTTTHTSNNNSDKVKDNLFDIDNSFQEFDNILLDVRLRKSLLYLFKFNHPTIIQKKTIPHIIKKKDVIIHSKTGTGKTLAYLIPVIQNLIKENLNEKEYLKFFYKCIIITPSDELCLQIHAVAQKLCTYLKDLVTVNHNINHTFYEHTTILITTPKLLCDYITENKKKHNLDILTNLKVLILDEADILHTTLFEKHMKTLMLKYLSKNYIQKYQIIMASATINKSVITNTSLFLHNPLFLSIENDKIEINDDDISGKLALTDDNTTATTTTTTGTSHVSTNQNNQTNNLNFNGKYYYYLYETELEKYVYLYYLIKNNTIKFKSL